MSLKMQEANNYFLLIERVGSKGKYQRNICIMFFLIWFISAFFVLGMAFMFMKSNYVCENIKDDIQCREYVCQLTKEERSKIMRKQSVYSVLHQFDKECSTQEEIANYKMSLFIGNVFGFVFFTFFADNFGRRFSLIMTLTIANIGIFLIVLSNSISMVCLGLFLAGAGLQSNLKINLAMINEVVDYNVRQTYSTLMQGAYGLGGVAIGIAYYYISHWHLITIIFCAFPALVLLILITLYVEQTPNFLMKKGPKQVLESLKRIAAINGLECQITQQEIENIFETNEQQQTVKKKDQQNINMSFLWRFKSLRGKTIYLSIIFFFIAAIYLGPTAIVDSFHFNPFLLQIIFSVSDGISNPMASLFIHQMSRKMAGIKFFGISALFLFISLFFSAKSTCQSCIESYIVISMLVLSRFCICYYYSILFLYTIQLYPQQIRGMGFGTVSIFGALGGVFIQSLTGIILYYHHNLLIYMLFFTFVCLYCIFQLPQTLQHPLLIEIEELKKKKIQQKYDPVSQVSTAQLQSIIHDTQRKMDESIDNIQE